MPLDPGILGTGLGALEPVDTEAEGIDNFMTAWEDYFSLASVSGVPTGAGSLNGALSTMRGAMTGVGNQDAAANIIQAAITAFWGVVAGAAPSIWVPPNPVVSATVPPGLGNIGTTIQGIFDSNTAGKLELAVCAVNVANALHPLQLGGIAITQPPPPSGPVPVPIL